MYSLKRYSFYSFISTISDIPKQSADVPHTHTLHCIHCRLWEYYVNDKRQEVELMKHFCYCPKRKNG